MEEASHDPKNPTLIPPPHNTLAKTILVTIVLLVLLFITGAAGYYVGSTTLFTELQMENATTTQNVATPTNNISSVKEDWKTYRNEKYGFEFQYPEGWNLVQEDNEFYGIFGINMKNIGSVSILPKGEADYGLPWEEPRKYTIKTEEFTANAREWDLNDSKKLIILNLENYPKTWSADYNRIEIRPTSSESEKALLDILKTLRFTE